MPQHASGCGIGGQGHKPSRFVSRATRVWSLPARPSSGAFLTASPAAKECGVGVSGCAGAAPSTARRGTARPGPESPLRVLPPTLHRGVERRGPALLRPRARAGTPHRRPSPHAQAAQGDGVPQEPPRFPTPGNGPDRTNLRGASRAACCSPCPTPAPRGGQQQVSGYGSAPLRWQSSAAGVGRPGTRRRAGPGIASPEQERQRAHAQARCGT